MFKSAESATDLPLTYAWCIHMLQNIAGWTWGISIHTSKQLWLQGKGNAMCLLSFFARVKSLSESH